MSKKKTEDIIESCPNCGHEYNVKRISYMYEDYIKYDPKHIHCFDCDITFQVGESQKSTLAYSNSYAPPADENDYENLQIQSYENSFKQAQANDTIHSNIALKGYHSFKNDAKIIQENKENITVHYPDELKNVKSDYIEGATTTITVNKYERDISARKNCIEHYGFKCSVCSFDFQKEFGEIGTSFIHVHHLKPLSNIKEEYNVDPINDLRPVCPNCHAMLHKKGNGGVYTIEELKDIREKNK